MLKLFFKLIVLTTYLLGCDSNRVYIDCFEEYEGPKTKAFFRPGTWRPYSIKGIDYIPQPFYEYSRVGFATWYGPGFQGSPTASGEKFDTFAYTAAHRTLPLPCVVKVTNLINKKSIIVKVNDRGPFADMDNRIIDLSKKSAQALNISGIAPVMVECLVQQSIDLIQNQYKIKIPKKVKKFKNTH